MIHIWSGAPDIPIAAARSTGDAEPMAKKRQPIDDLIDALVWMRRTHPNAMRGDRQTAACAIRHPWTAKVNLGPVARAPAEDSQADRAEGAEARYRPQPAAAARSQERPNSELRR